MCHSAEVGAAVLGPAPRKTGTPCQAQAGPPARSWRSRGVPLPSPQPPHAHLSPANPLLLASSPETTQHNSKPSRTPHLTAGLSRDGPWSLCRQKASWQLAKHRWARGDLGTCHQYGWAGTCLSLSAPSRVYALQRTFAVRRGQTQTHVLN